MNHTTSPYYSLPKLRVTENQVLLCGGIFPLLLLEKLSGILKPVLLPAEQGWGWVHQESQERAVFIHRGKMEPGGSLCFERKQEEFHSSPKTKADQGPRQQVRTKAPSELLSLQHSDCVILSPTKKVPAVVPKVQDQTTASGLTRYSDEQSEQCMLVLTPSALEGQLQQ